jgi:hypothetical protein
MPDRKEPFPSHCGSCRTAKGSVPASNPSCAMREASRPVEVLPCRAPSSLLPGLNPLSQGLSRSGRVKNGSARVPDDFGRVQSHSERGQNDSARVQSRSDRDLNRLDRVQSHFARVQSGSDRVQSQFDRVQSHSGRVRSDSDRVQSHSSRVQSDSDRDQNDFGRVWNDSGHIQGHSPANSKISAPDRRRLACAAPHSTA